MFLFAFFCLCLHSPQLELAKRSNLRDVNSRNIAVKGFHKARDLGGNFVHLMQQSLNLPGIELCLILFSPASNISSSCVPKQAHLQLVPQCSLP